MAFQTDREKVEHLNDFYSDNLTKEQAVDQFDYLTSNQRAKRTTKAHIIKCHRHSALGSLLKRLDPIAFNLAE